MKPDSFLFHIPKGSTITFYSRTWDVWEESIVTTATSHSIYYKRMELGGGLNSLNFSVITSALHEIRILSPTIGLFKLLNIGLVMITKLEKEGA